jgi:hypothetical protein
MSNDFTNDNKNNKNNDIVDIHIVILPDADVVCEAATGVAAATCETTGVTCEATGARLVPREILERAIRPSIYLHI